MQGIQHATVMLLPATLAGWRAKTIETGCRGMLTMLPGSWLSVYAR